MKNKTLILAFLIAFVDVVHSQIPGSLPRRYARADQQGGSNFDDVCESTVKVADEQPLNCSFSSPVFYPVFIENFDYKPDLLLNFEFNYPGNQFGSTLYHTGSGASTSTAPCGTAYLGNAYDNNIDIVNGEAHLKVKKEQIYVSNVLGCGTSNLYDFTASILHTLPRFKTGIFVAKIKLPDNPNFWQAYWLFGTNPRKQEIDVFEHYDANISGTPCDQYRQMKMTNHRYDGAYNAQDNTYQNHCYRDAVFPTANGFFDTDHIYQLTWTDYRVLIYLDQQLVGVATRYYDKPWYNTSFDCLWKPGNTRVPTQTYDCVGLNNLSNGLFNQKKVFKDMSFPTGDQPMNVILANGVFYPNNNFNNFSAADMEIKVDYMYVWQQIDCNVDKSICTLVDFFNEAGGTNYLTGRTISVGTSGCNDFKSNVSPNFLGTSNPQYPNWRPHINMLAREWIGIDGEAEFEEGTYFRADVVDCNAPNTYLLSQRATDEEKNTLTYVPIPDNIDYLNADGAFNNETMTGEIDEAPLKITAIKLYPNPANNVVYIDMNEEDFNDLVKIEITNVLGQKISMPIAPTISIEELKPGVYYMTFYLSSGLSSTKQFVKE
jgi:hypothetical protein